MFDGKLKAVTFSYDDGVTQDQRLIKLFDKYGLKATFNLNSALLGKPGSLVREDVTVAHVKPRPQEVRAIYSGHEVAVHTLTHPNLTELDEDEIVRQVEDDRVALSELVGYDVRGMAYPCGGVNNDDRVAEIIGRRTGVRFSRTIKSTFSFEPQANLLRFNPTVYTLNEWDQLFALGKKLIDMKPDSPQIMYVWGHAYEFDIHGTWELLEDFCKLISGRDDIFYGTNSQVLLGDK